MWLAGLLGLLTDDTEARVRRASQQEVVRRLGLGARTDTRGDLAGRMRHVLRNLRGDMDVLVDLIVLLQGLVEAGMLPFSDVTSPWPESVPEPLRTDLGPTFPNPGVYSPLGELLEAIAAQIAAKHKAMRARGYVPYRKGWSPVLGWQATQRVWVPKVGWDVQGLSPTPLQTPLMPFSRLDLGTHWHSADLNEQPDPWAVWPWQTFYEQFLQVLDWVRATHPNPRAFAFRPALDAAKAWHATLPMETTPGGASRGVVVATFADGATIERLLTAKNLQDEGKAMGHCVANYEGYAASGDRLYFSYRDPQGHSQATWEMVPGRVESWEPPPITRTPQEPGLRWEEPPRTLQIQGPRNREIHDALAQRRIAGWYLRYALLLEEARTRLPEVAFLFPPTGRQVLPLRTLPQTTQEEWKAKTPGLDLDAQILADDATWTPTQLKWADTLTAYDDQAWSDGACVISDQKLFNAFYEDSQSYRRRTELANRWPDLVAVDPGLTEADLETVEGVERAQARLKEDLSPGAPLRAVIEAVFVDQGLVFNDYNLFSALRAQVEHLRLVEELREREWFEVVSARLLLARVVVEVLGFVLEPLPLPKLLHEAEVLDYDPSEEQSRADDLVPGQADDAWRAAKSFIEEWNRNNLTTFAWKEKRESRDEGRTWVQSEDEDEDIGTWLSFGFGYHGSDDPHWNAGDIQTSRPFQGSNYPSPLAALWGQGRVQSQAQVQAEAKAFAEKTEAFRATLEPGVTTLSPQDLFVAKPRALVEAALRAGVIVPMRIQRSVGLL
jgi:hypothetical protein